VIDAWLTLIVAIGAAVMFWNEVWDHGLSNRALLLFIAWIALITCHYAVRILRTVALHGKEN
jgi:hypothetical protein